MIKYIKRLLIFFIGLPVLALLIFALPQYNHLAFSVLVAVGSIAGAIELSGILRKKNLMIRPLEAAFLGGIIPIFTILTVSFNIDKDFLGAAFCIGILWIFTANVFSTRKRLESYINYTTAGLVVLVYPGLLMSWIIGLSAYKHAEYLILSLILITYLNDSAAWAAGMLFGKGNRGLVPASPNKSIAGFCGGLIFSILMGIAAVRFFPGAFEPKHLPWYISGGILGLLGGLASVLGDLAESCLKRSAGVKDSGTLIPGRGGMLDSIDSLAYVAPVFYLTFRLLFT